MKWKHGKVLLVFALSLLTLVGVFHYFALGSNPSFSRQASIEFAVSRPLALTYSSGSGRIHLLTDSEFDYSMNPVDSREAQALYEIDIINQTKTKLIETGLPYDIASSSSIIAIVSESLGVAFWQEGKGIIGKSTSHGGWIEPGSEGFFYLNAKGELTCFFYDELLSGKVRAHHWNTLPFAGPMFVDDDLLYVLHDNEVAIAQTSSNSFRIVAKPIQDILSGTSLFGSKREGNLKIVGICKVSQDEDFREMFLVLASDNKIYRLSDSGLKATGISGVVDFACFEFGNEKFVAYSTLDSLEIYSLN